MRRESSTVVVLVGAVGNGLLAALRTSPGISVARAPGAGTGGPSAEEPAAAEQRPGWEAGALALREAARRQSMYVIVPEDPLAGVAAEWRAMWDMSVGPGGAADSSSRPRRRWPPGAVTGSSCLITTSSWPQPRAARPALICTWARCAPCARAGWPSPSSTDGPGRAPAGGHAHVAAARPVVAAAGRAARGRPALLRRRPRRDPARARRRQLSCRATSLIRPGCLPVMR